MCSVLHLGRCKLLLGIGTVALVFSSDLRLAHVRLVHVIKVHRYSDDEH